jgi:hypothetical protein
MAGECRRDTDRKEKRFEKRRRKLPEVGGERKRESVT